MKIKSETQAEGMYQLTTSEVTISVEPIYLDAESKPDNHIYVWAYKVRIKNSGKDTVQLKSRHWKITDSYGRINEVRGSGVVGEQPILKSGDSFEYTSGTPLSTPCGFMTGSYSMQTSDGKSFDAIIPVFSLDIPNTVRALN